MIDYLELYRQSGADALWEAVVRLAQPLPTAKAGRESMEPEHLGGKGRNISQFEQMEGYSPKVEDRDRLTREAEYRAEKIWAGNEQVRDAGNMGREFGPMAERADMKKGGSRPERPVWEMGQAEQLDRIFQRDSRRYDGGFFLY